MAAAPPHLVVMLVDDMGYGDFGSLNGGLSQTPRLDALMGESVCFSQSYTASCVCNPSRAALLTGRNTRRLRLVCEADLAAVVSEQFGGAALLSPVPN